MKTTNQTEIKCPCCGESFIVDESAYMRIVAQVKDKEWNKEILERTKLIEEKTKAKAESEIANLQIKLEAEKEKTRLIL